MAVQQLRRHALAHDVVPDDRAESKSDPKAPEELDVESAEPADVTDDSFLTQHRSMLVLCAATRLAPLHAAARPLIEMLCEDTDGRDGRSGLTPDRRLARGRVRRRVEASEGCLPWQLRHS